MAPQPADSRRCCCSMPQRQKRSASCCSGGCSSGGNGNGSGRESGPRWGWFTTGAACFARDNFDRGAGPRRRSQRLEVVLLRRSRSFESASSRRRSASSLVRRSLT
ncbi:hypothetical protein ACFPRL_01985 [Pseudoclavibacter helvolus]